jgi:hypothetical protein
VKRKYEMVMEEYYPIRKKLEGMLKILHVNLFHFYSKFGKSSAGTKKYNYL